MWLPLDKMCQLIIVSRRDRFIIIQYVPREHFFLSYVTVCTAFRIITTCSYNIAAQNSCSQKNPFLGSQTQIHLQAIPSCCLKLTCGPSWKKRAKQFTCYCKLCIRWREYLNKICSIFKKWRYSTGCFILEKALQIKTQVSGIMRF